MREDGLDGVRWSFVCERKLPFAPTGQCLLLVIALGDIQNQSQRRTS
jgi:hypothetical protein